MALLTAVEVALRAAPLPAVSCWFGVPLSITSPASAGDAFDHLSPLDQRRVLLAARVAARWPFGRGPCLREALVEGYLLRRRKPVLRIGAAPTGGPDLIAHAWVEVDGMALGDQAAFVPFVARRS